MTRYVHRKRLDRQIHNLLLQGKFREGQPVKSQCPKCKHWTSDYTMYEWCSMCGHYKETWRDWGVYVGICILIAGGVAMITWAMM